MATKVVNLYTEKYDVYIGRAGRGQDGYFGNPHIVGNCALCNGVSHSQEEAVEAFRKYFLNRVSTDAAFAAKVQTLKGKILGCFCKPKSCHGDVIKEFLDD